MNLFVTLFAIAAMAMAEEANKNEQLFNTANNQFTSRMFTEVVKNNPEKSVVLSAYSVLNPLAMLGIASVGQTHDELLRAIGFPNDNATKEVLSLENNKLRSVKGVDLRMANRVYIPKSAELNDNFATVARDVFHSEVRNVDFTASSETADEINAWVEEQTNHRIKNLVDPDSLNADTRALLVNAIYFKGTWQDKFDANATTERDFHVTKDKTVKLPTMHRKGTYKYTESAELQAKILELPYEGEESSFLVVLPNEIDGLAALEEKLKDPTALDKAVNAMFTYEVDVYLPKFKIETTTDLKDILEKIDVKQIFSNGAQLDNLIKGEQNLYVSKAVQKAFIEVNEEGAEAAAANEVDILPGMPAPPPEVHTFVVDKPFYFSLKIKSVAVVTGILTQ